MENINIAKDFSKRAGARNYADGEKSGEEFFHELLLPKFQAAVDRGGKLQIIMDGTEGFPSSFISEAFRLLAEKFGDPDFVWNRLIIVSSEIPRSNNKKSFE